MILIDQPVEGAFNLKIALFLFTTSPLLNPLSPQFSRMVLDKF
jgi:hypothetical protein